MSKWSGPEKYFDIGMVRDNQLGIILSQNISLKNAYLQAHILSLRHLKNKVSLLT